MARERSCGLTSWPPDRCLRLKRKMPNLIGELRAVQLLQERLVIEEVHLRRSAALEQVDDSLRPGTSVCLAESCPVLPGVCLAPHARERDAAEAHPETIQEAAAADAEERLVSRAA